ncbi:ATP-binding protein [Maribacter sp. X9]|uniref:tetratricopeptide repeat-containing sensor histidine kinase n=1 Tax=Maribacter sp. X9 TaxID=3402159 RepID=UPI003AF392CA
MFLPFYSSKGGIICIVALLLFTNSVFSQTSKRDSLLFEINLQRKAKDFNLKDTVYINSLIHLAFEFRYHNLDSVAVLSNESLSLSEEVDFTKGKIESYINIGGFYSDKGKVDKAIFNFNRAYELSHNFNNPKLKVESLIELSTEYSHQGNYALALEGYLEAIEIAEEMNLTILLSIINENIADLYLTQKDYDEAMFFFKKVKRLNEDIGDPIFTAETMSNMASAYADMNELEHAMFNINQSIPVFEEKRIIDWLAYCYEVKGKIYLKKGKNKWALYWYRQSEMLHEQIQDNRGKIALLNGMAEASLNLKKDSISEVYAQKAFDISKKIDFKEGIEDSSKLLYQLNKKQNNFQKALSYLEIYKTMSDSLALSDNQKALNMLKTKMEYDQQKQQLILENEKALAKQKTYIYIFIVILVIFFVIVLIVRRNEQIHKKLNKELLSKKKDLEEKQHYLNELNQTKNKLFSIIGHDLRGPIGAFQGLLKLFKEGEMTKKEFLNFVPKLKVDIDTISFTLNNLLFWGQSQMNGSTTTPAVTNLNAIVEENMSLLSEIADSKSITLMNRIEPDCQIWSDPNQIDIIIRNLLSNALKFTPNNGQIIIGAIQKLKNCEIYVKDNGMGMSEETMGKLFQKDANHTTYGTNDEKGTGLGLSLCKEMVEKNQGKIWVNSALGHGSSFYFTIPRATEHYKRSA